MGAMVACWPRWFGTLLRHTYSGRAPCTFAPRPGRDIINRAPPGQVDCFVRSVQLLLAAWLASSALLAEQLVDGRRSVVLEGSRSQLVLDILGGSIVSFRMKGHDLNPLRWANSGPAGQPRSMSHFLCLDRWGLPSESEAGNGMPAHGEASKVAWTVTREERTAVQMSADLPMAGLRVQRLVELAPDAAWFRAVETVTNRNRLGRVYNMVQHPTLGPPFLDETVVVDSNAGKGFAQGGPMPSPEKPAVHWPFALKDGQSVDLRRLEGDHSPAVVSFVVDGEIGWVTASNAAKGLLIGYLWRTADYPWLNIWRRSEDGRPLARGLEFGTTGLHRPFEDLVRKARIFDRPIVDFLDASDSKTRSYVGFLARIPASFQGVGDVSLSEGAAELVEIDGNRRIIVPVPVGF